ncbi:aspartate aminotransferase family protein [bacterium]|nr:MAG: aspartate aminotransferase family protein [bacterium]
MQSIQKVLKWGWPERAGTVEEIRGRLKDAFALNVDYDQRPVLGFPGTKPLEVAVESYCQFLSAHPNNIGCHTRRVGAESGFAGTHALEREYLYQLATLFGAHDPEGELDTANKINGFMCSGGTEANFAGLWIARNKLLGREAGRVAILTSWLTHYSIRKNCDELLIGEGQWKRCDECQIEHVFSPSTNGSGLHLLPTDQDGQIMMTDLEMRIRELFESKWIRHFIIVLNAGTINMGSIDPIPEVCAVVQALQKKHGSDISFYVHVDAAFGGYVIPFLEPSYPFAFQNQLVDSVSVDVHKMGMAPYPAGVFLCRRDLQENIQRQISYISGHVDETPAGSRPGASAAAAWAAMKYLGREGYTKIVAECIRKLTFLRELLWQSIPGVEFYPGRINILAVSFPEHLTRFLKERPVDGGPSLAERYCLPSDEFPSNFCDINSCSKTIFRFITMPHLKEEHVREFVSLLRAKV